MHSTVPLLSPPKTPPPRHVVAAVMATALFGAACERGATNDPVSAASPAPQDTQSGEPDVSVEPEPEGVPAPPQMFRLTARQYRNTLLDTFGPEMTPPSSLEVDLSVDGLLAIGATVKKVSPIGVEKYFNAALALSKQIVEKDSLRSSVLTCTPSAPDDTACLETLARQWATTLYRRPVTDAEVTEVVGIAKDAGVALGTANDSVVYLFTTLFSSPHFIYRVELGESDGADGRRLNAHELASRLSYYLWNSAPDGELLAAAADGSLLTEPGRVAQVDRMLASPKARRSLRNFFAEWLHLYDLDGLTKDPTVFKHYSPELGGAAREETLRVVEHLFAEQDRPYREFFTTRTTFVDRRLAAIYNVAAPDEDFGELTFPEDSVRAGVLGHVSFLALHSHPVSSSATLRGMFVREQLLCDPVPSAPADANTAIPEVSPTAKTLRERLTVHMEDDACGACHRLMDPVGFGLENFDGIGRFRVLDNGGVIDPRGFFRTLNDEGDQVDLFFESPEDLRNLIVESAMRNPCFVRTLYSYALGHLPTEAEEPYLADLTDEFVSGGERVLATFRAIALSDAFSTVTEVQ